MDIGADHATLLSVLLRRTAVDSLGASQTQRRTWRCVITEHVKTFVILLRGVTPAGKNKVPMAALRTALTKAGLREVRTYIQSGNVIVSSELTQAKLERLVHDIIRQNFGGDIPVVARTVRQFADILKRNPFLDTHSARVYFTLFAASPDRKLLKAFLSIDFWPDQVRFTKDVLYTLYATRHSDSRFNNNFFERKLNVTATTRNYNTMIKLVALAAAQQGAPAGAKRRRG